MSTPINVDPTIGNFEQPVLPVADPLNFSAVRNAVEASFSTAKIREFLKSLTHVGLRIRNFEDVLGQGLLGQKTISEYASLGNADQGQIRELYLASLEKVAPDLRQKYFKLYAYY